MAYKYSGRKGKGHPKGDFRSEKPKLVRTKRNGGGWTWIQGCDEFMGGRWEGFVAMKYGGRVFKTKAAALKHSPKW